ncbi:hypothetical protein [Agrococcus sp. DT81.2]|jgi:hypothetical protein|uniref:hypothetical protein n=1 Tax=Agrococcus sp. DT81.2 TaxID=3393414 RepID=UPI003CE5192A
MHPLVVVGLCAMVASCFVSGIDAIRSMRSGREPERRMRAFLIAGGLLLGGGILVLIGVSLG